MHQTRKYFMEKYGSIVDNPHVGAELRDVYWQPGNSEPFLSLVQKLTGEQLSSTAWVETLERHVEDVILSEHEAYLKALEEGPQYPPGSSVDLDMKVLLVHGDEVIADSQSAGLAAACEKYRAWVGGLDMLE